MGGWARGTAGVCMRAVAARRGVCLPACVCTDDARGAEGALATNSVVGRRVAAPACVAVCCLCLRLTRVLWMCTAVGYRRRLPRQWSGMGQSGAGHGTTAHNGTGGTKLKRRCAGRPCASAVLRGRGAVGVCVRFFCLLFALTLQRIGEGA